MINNLRNNSDGKGQKKNSLKRRENKERTKNDGFWVDCSIRNDWILIIIYRKCYHRITKKGNVNGRLKGKN